MSARRPIALLVMAAVGIGAGCGRPPIDSADGGRLIPETRRFAQTFSLPGDFETLRDALEISQRGDVIELAPGVYQAGLNVETLNLTLRGSGIGRTVLINGLNVVRGGLRIEDLTIRADGDAFGIHSRRYSFIAKRIEVEGFSFGISVFDASRPTQINESIFRGNQQGLYVREANVTVMNGVFLFNAKAGVFSRSGASVRLYHGTYVGNGFSNPGEASGAIVLGPGGVPDVRNNVIVGNQYGIQCQGCASNPSHNLVWGNVQDYVGEAARAASDVNADPRFADPGAGDFRLRAGSPAIDVGVQVGANRDASGEPRPAGIAPDLGAYEWHPSTALVVINEVMANPLVERSGEFVELLNVGDDPVDLAGYILDDFDDSDPLQAMEDGGPTTILPGGYALLLDPDYADVAGLPDDAVLLTVNDRSLGNGLSTGDPVYLRLPDGNTVVSAYESPFDPGDGVSAERTAPDSDIFVPSPCGASPGALNCVAGGGEPNDPEAPIVLITEVMANPLDESKGEYIEILNLGEAGVDLAGWTISDGDSVDFLRAFGDDGDGPLVLPGRGSYAVIVDLDYDGRYDIPLSAALLTVGDRRLGNSLSSDDPITLRDADGTLIATYLHPFDPGNGRSAELASLEAGDVAGGWVPAPCGLSPGLPNCAWEDEGVGPGPLTVVLTEVMANPLNEDTGEFVEIFNDGDEDVDLSEILLTDDDVVDTLEAFEPGGPTTLAPGGYAVVLDPEYAGEYGIPPGTLRMRPDDTTLGSGLAVNDPVRLIGDGEVLSELAVPFNPGNGRSAEWTGEAWTASTCATGASPGRRNCAAGEPDDPAPVGADVRITEVMANPLVERTGEFVEVVNFGDEPVDLAGWILFDGDAVDPLVRWPGLGGGTRLQPGDYGVILDPDFNGDYRIAPDAVLLTTSDHALGSGLSIQDPVTLLLPDGVTVVTRFAAPFNPGNGRSAVRAAADGDEFVATDCGDDAEVHATPGGDECPAPQLAGDPLACEVAEDCEQNWRCMGFPNDGSGQFGRCANVRGDYPGEYEACDAHADCEDRNMVCAGMTVFPGSAFCIAKYHHGEYRSEVAADGRAIPDDDDAGLRSTIVVYGLATVPLDLIVTAQVDHPDRSQLRLTLLDPRGDRAVVFDGVRHPAEALDGPMIALGDIPRDDYCNGRWTLEVVDTAAGDAGTLMHWGLEVISNWD